VIFPTTTFAVFFCIVLVASWLLMPHPRVWRLFIIAASFVFYADWNWKFVGLLAFSILWNQAIAVGIFRSKVRSQRKLLLTLGVAVDVGLLGYFKYYDFFVSSGHNVLQGIGLGFPLGIRSIILPVGISFFTFMAISYVVDVYRGELEPTSLPKFGAYLSFFPHLVAGPIVRGSELLPQLDTPRDPRRVDTSRAFYLIATGLFKKVVIANYLATNIVDAVFGAPVQHSSLETWVGVIGYSVQIYADFSGYTDMAIGLALLLGFKFPQNFDSPYAAISIQDFWRRWHMTLSRWLRDYVYIPLGGNRKGEPRTYLNLMATMLIGGLWHGAAWSFVIWGGLHGSWLAIGRWRRERGHLTDATSGWGLWRQRIATFALVCFAWIFFRAGSENGLSTAWEVIKRLFDNWGAASPLLEGRAGLGIALAIIVGIGTQYLPARIPQAIMAWFSRRQVVVQVVVLALALMVSRTMGPQGVAPFIYFQF
jgi:alginate O-acetyltransferase complex protein AlgI